MPLCDEEQSRLSSHASRKLMLTVANPTEIARDLWADGIFVNSDLDRINHEVTQHEKLILLMEILPRRLESLEQLIPILSRYRCYKPIVALLTNSQTDQEASAVVASARRRSVVSFAKPLTFEDKLEKTIDSVRSHYKNNFRYLYPVPGFKEFCYEVDDVWVSLDLDSNASDRGKTEFYRSTLLSALAQQSLVFFRGVPGAGKSTLAKLICYDWANGKLPRYDLVLFGTLAQTKTCDSILDLVLAQMFRRVLRKAQIELVSNQRDELMTGEPRDEYESSEQMHTLIVLDGLDEYTGGCEELDWLLEQNQLPNLEYALLITARPDGMKNVACQGVMVNLAGFDIDQQEEYIWRHVSRARGLQASAADECKMELEAIKAKLHKSSGLRKLAHTPLILTYVCLVHAELETNTIVELFEKVCLYLIRRFVQEHPAMADLFEGDWRQSQVMASLCELALHGLLCNESGMAKVVFSEKDLENTGVQPICQQIGYLVSEERFEEDSVKKTTCYWFHHKSLQDYLAAYGLSVELKTVPRISATIAQTYMDRLMQKSGQSAKPLVLHEFMTHKADTEAIGQSKWLTMVFEHPSINPIPTYSWQFLLELAAESGDPKFAHNALTLWLSSGAKLLNIEIDFGLLYKLYQKTYQTDRSLLLLLRLALSERIDHGYTYPELLTAVQHNVQQMFRLDDHEYVDFSLSINIFTDAAVQSYLDFRADWLREYGVTVAFNHGIVHHSLLGELCSAMKIYTQISSLKVHVDGSFHEPNINALPMHWRQRLPFHEPPPLAELMKASAISTARAADLERSMNSIQATLEAHGFDPQGSRRNQKCSVEQLFIECDTSRGCEQFELASLLKDLYYFGHVERIVLRGIRQRVVVADLPATFERIDTKSLTELCVEKVHIATSDVQALIHIVSRAVNLNSFRLLATGIDGSDLIRTTDAVKLSCSLLQIYSVQEECLKIETVFQDFCKIIRHWKCLDTLRLRGNKLSNKLIRFLLQAVPTMPGLTLVNLVDNYVTDATLSELRSCADVAILTGT